MLLIQIARHTASLDLTWSDLERPSSISINLRRLIFRKRGDVGYIPLINTNSHISHMSHIRTVQLHKKILICVALRSQVRFHSYFEDISAKALSYVTSYL